MMMGQQPDEGCCCGWDCCCCCSLWFTILIVLAFGAVGALWGMGILEVEFQKPDFRLPKTRKAEARKAKSAKDKKDAEAEKLRLFNLPLKVKDVAVAQALLPIANPDEKHTNI